MLKGGLPALVVYLVASAFGAEPSTAGFIALSALTLLLLVVGYLGAFRAGLRELRLRWRRRGPASSACS